MCFPTLTNILIIPNGRLWPKKEKCIMEPFLNRQRGVACHEESV